MTYAELNAASLSTLAKAGANGRRRRLATGGQGWRAPMRNNRRPMRNGRPMRKNDARPRGGGDWPRLAQSGGGLGWPWADADGGKRAAETGAPARRRKIGGLGWPANSRLGVGG